MKSSKKELQKFAAWVAKQVCSGKVEDHPEAFEEVACRKLHRMGFVSTDGKNWIFEYNEEDVE